LGPRLIADPRTARITAVTALILGVAFAVTPTVIALSRTPVKQAVVLHTGPSRAAVLTRRQTRAATVDYVVTTRFVRHRIEQGTLEVAPEANISVPLPLVVCATPVVVRTLEVGSWRTRSVALTVLPPAGVRPQCGE
jgi:hypothetical protein